MKGIQMNIQIFGTKKCNDTKKAERFFKERRIQYQFIDLKEKSLCFFSIITFFCSKYLYVHLYSFHILNNDYYT